MQESALRIRSARYGVGNWMLGPVHIAERTPVSPHGVCRLMAGNLFRYAPHTLSSKGVRHLRGGKPTIGGITVQST